MSTRALLRLLLLALTLALGFACGDDESSQPADAGPSSQPDAATGMCDTFDTEHEQLLNAETTATVIHKTPTHPPVGDGPLP
jgi:hypothetical protein